MTERQLHKHRHGLRGRNLATLFALLGFVALMYLVALARMATI